MDASLAPVALAELMATPEYQSLDARGQERAARAVGFPEDLELSVRRIALEGLRARGRLVWQTSGFLMYEVEFLGAEHPLCGKAYGEWCRAAGYVYHVTLGRWYHYEPAAGLTPEFAEGAAVWREWDLAFARVNPQSFVGELAPDSALFAFLAPLYRDGRAHSRMHVSM
jgi:hypothetical protein